MILFYKGTRHVVHTTTATLAVSDEVTLRLVELKERVLRHRSADACNPRVHIIAALSLNLVRLVLACGGCK